MPVRLRGYIYMLLGDYWLTYRYANMSSIIGGKFHKTKMEVAVTLNLNQRDLFRHCAPISRNRILQS